MSRWAFSAIGTAWEIETAHELEPGARQRVSDVIAAFDAEWSRFRSDSVVAGLRAHGGAVPAPQDTVTILDAYRDLSAATGGAVNPLVGGSLEALGYDAAVSLRAGDPVAAPADWERRVQWNSSTLSLSEPATLDIGALGKGRLVDRVLAALENVSGRVVVDGSGDMVVRGGEARVALEHPLDPSRAIGIVTVRDQALCASAINRRAWGNGLHHVLDARTGQPVRTWGATWAVGPDAMRADAIATALFFDGAAELAADWGVEWARMSTDGRAQQSPGFAGEIFTGPAG